MLYTTCDILNIIRVMIMNINNNDSNNITAYYCFITKNRLLYFLEFLMTGYSIYTILQKALFIIIICSTSEFLYVPTINLMLFSIS